MWVYFLEAFIYIISTPVTILSLSSMASLEEKHERNWKIGFPVPLTENWQRDFFLSVTMTEGIDIPRGEVFMYANIFFFTEKKIHFHWLKLDVNEFNH
jgi:hypothetical protein